MQGWPENLVRHRAKGMQINDCPDKELAQLLKKIRKINAALLIYAAWNIWKERNRRVFDQKYVTPQEVLHKK